jgi:glycerophosphoryl diester phosphodiesterase
MIKYLRFFGSYLRSAPKILLFEIMYKLLIAALGMPLLSFLVQIAMNYAGVSYLNMANMKEFLLNPVTAVVLVLLMFLVAFFSFIEFTALTACFAYRIGHRKLTIAGMLRCSFRAFAKAFRGKGILSFLKFMIIIVPTQLIFASGIISSSLIQPMRNILGSFAKPVYITSAVLLALLFIWIIAGRCYSLHYLMLTENKFSECSAKSKRCLNGKRLKTAYTLILWGVLSVAAAAAAVIIISFLIIFGIKGFSSPNAAFLSSLRVLSYAIKVFYAVSMIIAVPFIIGCLTSRFFDDMAAEGEKITFPEINGKKYPKPVKALVFTAAAAVGIFLNFAYIREFYRGNIDFSAGIFTRTQVTAHRGFSYVAPENTMYAFQEAVDINADYIELDVQLTADGQPVIFHDSDISRITGEKGSISDYTYDELLEFSAGSWFKRGETDYSDARIPLLAEVLELAKENNILLNIEIKQNDTAAETARLTAELLEEYDMVGACYVTSFDYSVLKEIKTADSDIKTALISNIGTPATYTQMKYIDAVSLNYSFVNKTIVNSTHKSGKRVFVWTVDKRVDIRKMIAMGVDNVITDRPDIAVEEVYSYSTGDLVLSILDIIFGT